MNKLGTLLRKEWLLNWQHSVYIYIYMLLVLTLLAPNYPYFVAFGYCLIGIPTAFSYFKGNKDLEFSAMLPISRENIVKSKAYAVMLIELVQIVLAIPFALLSALLINPTGNGVGLDANFTLFASIFIEFGVFNILFLPQFFKTGYKVAKPAFLAFVGYILTTIAIELIIALVPSLNMIFDGTIYWGAQLGLLCVSMIFYAVCMFVSYRLSVKNFLQVNL